MRLKDLFTVPVGQKITERHLYRVLISSVCSILLCMSCLAGTTWAWFAVSLENNENVIRIGSPEVTVTLGDNTSHYDPKTTLSGSSTVHVKHANEPDDLDKKSTLYVTLTIYMVSGDGGSITEVDDESSSDATAGAGDSSNSVEMCLVLDDTNGYQATIQIGNETNQTYQLDWNVSWFHPAGAGEPSSAPVMLAIKKPVVEETTAAETMTEESTQEELTTEAAVETTAEVSTEDMVEDTTEEIETEPFTTEAATTEPPTTEAVIPEPHIPEVTVTEPVTTEAVTEAIEELQTSEDVAATSAADISTDQITES